MICLKFEQKNLLYSGILPKPKGDDIDGNQENNYFLNLQNYLITKIGH